MIRILRFLTFSLLFALPFVVFPIGTSQFEVPKVIVGEVLIEALVFVAVLSRRRIAIGRIEKICLGVLLVVALLNNFLFPSHTSFFGNAFRQQGLFLFFHLILFSIFAQHFLLLKTPLWLLGGSLLLQLAGIFYFPPNDVGRAYGFLGEPNALASSVAFAIPLLFLPHIRRRFLFPGLLLCGIILFASGSRSGMIAACVQFVFLVLVQRYPRFLRPLFFLSCFLLAFSIIATFFFSSPQESRVEIWYAAALAFISHPIVGGGVGRVEVLLHDASQTFPSFISARYVDSSHNLFFDILLQTGLVGFIAFLLLLVSAFRAFLVRREVLNIALLLGMTTVLCFNPGSVWELIVFWYMVGEGITQDHSSHATIET